MQDWQLSHVADLGVHGAVQQHILALDVGVDHLRIDMQCYAHGAVDTDYCGSSLPTAIHLWLHCDAGWWPIR